MKTVPRPEVSPSITSGMCTDSVTHLGYLNINNNSLFNLSSFTISEANYRLTLGYHGIASSSLLNYISF
jgi:hypothetical protein